MQLHRLTRTSLWRRNRSLIHHRFLFKHVRVTSYLHTCLLVRPHMGSHAMQSKRHHREVYLRHRRLRLFPNRMLRRRSQPSGHTSRIHTQRLRQS
ncbi:hypothetical protein DY000_02020875 [Brassica cretica]|uniref:Uncharacterized protein n=1 Tax=Brassica cretica TaxID=69181 RepID=A0ABQ7E1Z4_BRACR|nr:hypothetical protein DY000_02020875 [Brassica cretica]